MLESTCSLFPLISTNACSHLLRHRAPAATSCTYPWAGNAANTDVLWLQDCLPPHACSNSQAGHPASQLRITTGSLLRQHNSVTYPSEIP